MTLHIIENIIAQFEDEDISAILKLQY